MIVTTLAPWLGEAVVARGGLVSYRSVLDSPFVHVPHDALPLDVFRSADMPDVWAHLAPKPLRLEGLVDGTNRRVTGDRLDKALRPVKEAYAKADPEGLVILVDIFKAAAEYWRSQHKPFWVIFAGPAADRLELPTFIH